MTDEEPQPFVSDESAEPTSKEKDKLVGNSLVNTNKDFINNKWRPMMAWTYMAICICDFILFPILWSSLQAMQHGAVSVQWVPITLEDSGLLHIAMGAVLGIAAYGRTQEKLQDRS